MQNAETVLGVLKNRGRRRLPVDELYRQLFNPALYLLAYGRVYANKGALTPGVDEQTADGMSVSVITRIIEDMRRERYRFTPVRRVRIPKKKGGTRPLGIPSWSDKLVQEVVRLLLEAYYEPQFSDQSHGFRPGRGCHTALREVSRCWTGTVWFIEGDIADCFGSLDHHVLLGILAEQIGDRRFLRLIAGMLKAGYLENFTWHATLSGAPQGAGCSPVLSNIYLDRLDRFVAEQLIPAHTRDVGEGGARSTRGPCANATDPGVKATGLPPRPRCAESTLSGRAIRWIRATAGCGMCVTPTIICLGSSDPKPRLSRSNNRSPVSCATS